MNRAFRWWRRDDSGSSLHYVVASWILIAIGYVALGRLGLGVATINDNASPIWPASGLAMFAIYRFGYSTFFSIFGAAWLVNFSVGTPILGALGIGFGNALEGLAGAIVLRICLDDPRLKGFAEFIGVIIAALAAPLVSASIGAVTLMGLGVLTPTQFWYGWYTWWSGDVVGAMLVLPVLLEIGSLNMAIKSNGIWRRLSVALAFLGAVILLSQLVFIGDWSQAWSWLVTPALVLAALYIGDVYARVAVLVLSGTLVYFTFRGFGGFEYGNTNLNLMYTQALLFCYSLATLTAKVLPKETFHHRSVLAFWLAAWTLFTVVVFETSFFERRRLTQDISSSVTSALEATSRIAMLYQILLRSAETVILAKPKLNSTEWRQFSDAMNLSEIFTAVNGVGFIESIKKSQIGELEHEYRDARGIKDFNVKYIKKDYADQFDTVYPITFVEPLAANLPAQGLDIGSEPLRRAAADLATKLHKPVASGPVQLVQDTKKRPGFLVLHPVYRSAGSTKAEDLWGWAYAPVIAESFFSKCLFGYTELFFSRVSTSDVLLFDDHFVAHSSHQNHLFLDRRSLNIFNRSYQFEFYPTDQFFARHQSIVVPVAFSLSIFILMMMSFITELVFFGAKAEALIRVRSRELAETHSKLSQAAKMSSLGEMAGGIAHEINNPLAIIGGKSEQLLRMVKNRTLDEQKLTDGLHIIDKTVERIAKIVRGMRSISRNADSDPLIETSITKIVDETLELCRERFKQSSIDLLIELKDNRHVLGRPAQISQVLMNLLNNAFDAVGSGADRWITIRSYAVGPHCALEVVNAGERIPDDIVPKLMEPFFTTKEVGRGTGLGLSISRTIAEDHGGRLYYDPQAPQTRFVLEIPALT